MKPLPRSFASSPAPRRAAGMRRRFRSAAPFALVCVLAGGLAGCTSGLLQSHAPPVQQYVLHVAPAAQPPTTPAGAHPSLRLLRPLPGPGLDTDRIALLQPGNRMDYYAAARWNGQLAEVLSSLAVETLRGSGTWSTVVDYRTAFNADYQLQVGIGHFEADYSGSGTGGGSDAAPVVNVTLDCLLIRRTDGAVAASFSTTASQPAAQNRMGSVVAAFEAAVNQALAQAAGEVARTAAHP